MKKETLEEAAKLAFTYEYGEETFITDRKRDAFIEGYKLAQERMYSKEDFKLFARQYYREIKSDKSNLLWDKLADKCLEQFKKK